MEITKTLCLLLCIDHLALILSFCLNSQEFLSQLVPSTDKVIVVGDFNIHVDVENDSLNINF